MLHLLYMPSKSHLVESFIKKQGYAIATSVPSTTVPIYILHCRLKKRLKVLTTIYIEDEIAREEMVFRITTRCDKAHKDKELFLIFLEQHKEHERLFNLTPACAFTEFQKWKKEYIKLPLAA